MPLLLHISLNIVRISSKDRHRKLLSNEAMTGGEITTFHGLAYVSLRLETWEDSVVQLLF